MSDAKRFDRRSLFDVLRRAVADRADEPRAFSLEAFYARREEAAASASAFPRVVHREGLASVETTAVGAGPTDPTKGSPA